MASEKDDDGSGFDLVKKRLPFNLTIAEWEVLKDEAKGEKTELINVTRRALREYFKARGRELPDNLFSDRKPGNRLPKPRGKELPVRIVEIGTGRSNTGELVAAFSPAPLV
jgi:hypothetical protein